jgi:hypothetical protein
MFSDLMSGEYPSHQIAKRFSLLEEAPWKDFWIGYSRTRNAAILS